MLISFSVGSCPVFLHQRTCFRQNAAFFSLRETGPFFFSHWICATFPTLKIGHGESLSKPTPQPPSHGHTDDKKQTPSRPFPQHSPSPSLKVLRKASPAFMARQRDICSSMARSMSA